MGFQADQLLIKPSRQLRFYLIAIHAVAILAVGISGLPLGLREVVMGVLLLQAWRLDRRWALGAVRAIRWESDQLWLQFHSGAWEACQMAPGALLHPRLMLLELQAASAKHRLVLFPDALGPAGYRRLLVVLRHQLSERQPQS